MLLSIQGNKILRKMWNSFSSSYLQKCPKANQPEVEKAFLSYLLESLVMHPNATNSSHDEVLREIRPLISEIK